MFSKWIITIIIITVDRNKSLFNSLHYLLSKKLIILSLISKPINKVFSRALNAIFKSQKLPFNVIIFVMKCQKVEAIQDEF